MMKDANDTNRTHDDVLVDDDDDDGMRMSQKNGKKRKISSTNTSTSAIGTSSTVPIMCNQDNPLEEHHDVTATHHNKGGKDDNDDNPATITSPTTISKTTTTKSPSWKERIKLAIEKRIQKEVKSKKYQRDIQTMKELMIDQHHRFLQRQQCVTAAASASAAMEGLSSGPGSVDSLQPRKNSITGYDREYRLELIGIRYKSRPLDVIHEQSNYGFGLKLYMEVDIVLNSMKKTQMEQQKQHQRQLPNIDPLLFDIQLSCVPQTNNQDNDESGMKIHTKSGIVPSLHIGQCVTILACVFVTDIHLIHEKSSMSSSSSLSTLATTPLRFVINVFWNNNHKYGYSNKTTNNDTNSITLGLIQFSPVIVLMNSSKTSSELQKYVFTTKSSSEEQSTLLSLSSSSSSLSRRTIYDYRKPTVIVLGITNELSANPLSEWEYRITHSLDQYLGDGSKIDIQYNNHNNVEEKETRQQQHHHQLQLRISIYAESIPHRTFLVELVKKHLPEGINVLYSTNELLTEESLIRLLRKAIKEEIRIMAKHYKMDAISLTQMKDFRRDLLSECKKKEMSLDEWEEFRRAQSWTDGLNDRLTKLRKDKVKSLK